MKSVWTHKTLKVKTFSQCHKNFSLSSVTAAGVKLRSAVVACSSVLLVFENELDVLVGEGHQVGADQGHHSVQNRRLDQVHVPDPPEEP